MFWLFGLGCGALVTLATPMAVLLTILLAPSIAVRATDSASAFRRTISFGLAASITPALSLWSAHPTIVRALDLAGQSNVLAIAWGAQGGGWLLGEILPAIIGVVLSLRTVQERSALRAQRRRYEKEWGLPPPQTELQAPGRAEAA